MRISLHSSALALALIIAAPPATATETFITARVSRVLPLGSGAIQISMAEDAPTCTNASVPKRFLLSVSGPMTADGFKNVYAALLYASAADKDVGLYFDDATSNCAITRVLVLN
jgi:hypothetical protein